MGVRMGKNAVATRAGHPGEKDDYPVINSIKRRAYHGNDGGFSQQGTLSGVYS
jgi:hypothetical protein